MRVQNRKVLFAKVVIEGNTTFEQLLMNEEYMEFQTDFRGKTIEASHIEDCGTYITGLFVATQKRDIPPAHTPGDDNDYVAVDLGDGRGLAFPSVFIFDKEHKVLLYEVNFFGANESGIEQYFKDMSESLTSDVASSTAPFKVRLLPVMKTNIQGRIDNLWRIKKVEMQVAKPQLVRRQIIEENGLMSDAIEIAENINAQKGINITLYGSNDGIGGSIFKRKINELYRDFTRIPHSNEGRFKNKLIIIGEYQDEEARVIEDTINVMLDRLMGYFRIEVEPISRHIYVTNRKTGIKNVYNSLYDVMRQSI